MLYTPALLKAVLRPKKPNIIRARSFQASAASITMDYPANGKGVLHVAYIARLLGGVTIPTLPTGWTSLATASSNPLSRWCYKFSNGSEGPTFSSSSTSATDMVGVVYSIDGCDSSVAPTINTNATTLDPTSDTPGTIGKPYLYLAYYGARGAVPGLLEYPSGYVEHPTTVETANGGICMAGKHDVYKTEDPSAFVISTSPTAQNVGFIMIPGF